MAYRKVSTVRIVGNMLKFNRIKKHVLQYLPDLKGLHPERWLQDDDIPTEQRFHRDELVVLDSDLTPSGKQIVHLMDCGCLVVLASLDWPGSLYSYHWGRKAEVAAADPNVGPPHFVNLYIST